MSALNRIKHVFRMCGHALTITLHERLDKIIRDTEATRQELQSAKLLDTHAALLQSSIHVVESLHALAPRTVIEAGGEAKSPEAGLIEFLYSHVPVRRALNLDGDHARFAGAFERAGFEIHSSRGGSNGRGVAVSTAVEPVGILAVGSYAAAEIGLHQACVVVTSLSERLAEMVADMRAREYHWHVVVFQTRSSGADGSGASFVSNYSGVLPDAFGSVFFFRDFKVFAEAQAWCAATLRRTYIK